MALKFFASFVFCLIFDTLSTGYFVRLLVFQAHKSLAFITLLGSSTTGFNVVKKLLECEQFSAILACLWSKFAMIFMVPELGCNLTKLAELALNLLMSIGLVLVLFRFRHDFATNLAFKVIASTSDVVHAEFGDFNHAIARRALLLLFYSFDHFVFFEIDAF